MKDPDSVEYQLALRQLAIKDCNSNSWLITVNEILLSYELPSAHKILSNPKNIWKPITHTKIDNFWKNKWSEDAKTKSTLSYMETDTWKYKQPNVLEQCQRQQTRRQKRSNKMTSFDRNIQNPTYHQPL